MGHIHTLSCMYTRSISTRLAGTYICCCWGRPCDPHKHSCNCPLPLAPLNACLHWTILCHCLYAYMHVHINMCKYQWKEFGGQPQVSCSLGPHRTIAASGRKSLLLFDYVITNGQYIHSECDRCLWPHIRGLNPLKNVSEHMSRFPQYH